MVSKPTQKRQAIIIARKQSRYLTSGLFLVLVATLIIVLFLLTNNQPINETYEFTEASNLVQQDSENASEDSGQTDTDQPPRIDFQPVVDTWVNSNGGVKSVLIYDLDLDETVGLYKEENNYNTASLYKLFVVYEGYRRIQNGEWRGEDQAGTTGKTILKCLDFALRESNSPCAETIWKKIGQKKLDKIIEQDFDIHNSRISALSSNARDVAKMMQIIYHHVDIKDSALITQLNDSLLNQPVTTDDWRKGLPSGFKVAKVYNKVGWAWNDGQWDYYHDAAIVEFPDQNRHYVVVVMTSHMSNSKIANFGSLLEDAFLVSTK